MYFDRCTVGATAINQGIYIEETADWILGQFGDNIQQNFTSTEIEAAFEWVSYTGRTKIVVERRSACHSFHVVAFSLSEKGPRTSCPRADVRSIGIVERNVYQRFDQQLSKQRGLRNG